MANCFWFHQGKCQLYTMPADMVRDILSSTPKAREDITKCGLSCPDVDLEFLEYANDPRTLNEPSDLQVQRDMQRVNRYRDIMTLLNRPRNQSGE